MLKKPHIIAIANQKGGVGKTTTAVNLATALCSVGRSVLLIDMDPQGNAGTGLGVKRTMLKRTVYDVLFERCGVEAVIVETAIPGLHILPSSVHLSGAEVELATAPRRQKRLKAALEGNVNYDYVLIDCPPSLNFLTLNALTAADDIIVPLQCEFYALEGLAQLSKTVDLVRQHYNPSLSIRHIVLTMYDRRNRITRLVEKDVRDYFKDVVCRTVIPRNVRLSEAPSYGMPALIYDMHSRGAQSYIALAKEILHSYTYNARGGIQNKQQTTEVA